MTRPRLRTLGVLLAAALLAGAIVAAPASAKIRTKVSWVDVTYRKGPNPNNAANCSVIGVASIPLNLGATKMKVRFRVEAGGGSFVWQEAASTTGPLFDSDLLYVKEYNAGENSMWTVVTSSAEAGGTDKCKALEARLKKIIRGTVKVVLTYEDDEDKACGRLRTVQEEAATAHRKALRAWNKLPPDAAPGGAKDMAKQYSDMTESRWKRAKQYRKQACEVQLDSRSVRWE